MLASKSPTKEPSPAVLLLLRLMPKHVIFLINYCGIVCSASTYNHKVRQMGPTIRSLFVCLPTRGANWSVYDRLSIFPSRPFVPSLFRLIVMRPRRMPGWSCVYVHSLFYWYFFSARTLFHVIYHWVCLSVLWPATATTNDELVDTFDLRCWRINYEKNRGGRDGKRETKTNSVRSPPPSS